MKVLVSALALLENSIRKAFKILEYILYLGQPVRPRQLRHVIVCES